MTNYESQWIIHFKLFTFLQFLSNFFNKKFNPKHLLCSKNCIRFWRGKDMAVYTLHNYFAYFLIVIWNLRRGEKIYLHQNQQTNKTQIWFQNFSILFFFLLDRSFISHYYYLWFVLVLLYQLFLCFSLLFFRPSLPQANPNFKLQSCAWSMPRICSSFIIFGFFLYYPCLVS